MCIIVSKSIDGSKILAKNRDRAYKPSLEIVHTLIDGVEVAYLRDTITDWSEGMNEYGVGLVNTALMVGYDENEKKIVKKGGKPSKDGKKIRKALSQKTIRETINSAITFDGGIKGHTFIATPTKTVCIEIVEVNPCLDEKENTMAEVTLDILEAVITTIKQINFINKI
mgnify:CR=1 FL=1